MKQRSQRPEAIEQRTVVQIVTVGSKRKDLVFQILLDRADLPWPVAEYRFHPTRKWRFDYAWVEAKLALEVDGGIWTGGKHGRGAGIVKDQEKRNAAACLGWRLLVVTPRELASLRTIHLVKEALVA